MQLAVTRTIVTDLDAQLASLHPVVVRRLTLVLGNQSDAEDIAQSAIERALKAKASFHGGNLHAWLLTIALRLGFNELRRRKRAAGAAAVAAPTWVISSDVDLWHAIGAIEPQARAALLLSVLDGYTHEEIGRMLDAPLGTVSSWISRTKDRLRIELEEDHDGSR